MLLDRKYVIIAAIVAFVSWAYLTDWIPSLRWIPHAFAAGVVATVCGLLFLFLTTSRGVRHREDADATSPPAALAFTAPGAWEEEKAALRSRAEYRRPLIFPEAVEFSRASDELLDLILRDYVTSWYRGISDRPLFQHEIDRCIRSVLLTLAARLTNFDLVQIGVSNALPVVTAHFKEFYDAERAVRGKDLSHSVTESEELNAAIASKYGNEKLHVVASLGNSDTIDARQGYSRGWVCKLLPLLLPENMKSSPAVTTIVRELVTCAVLGPVLQALVDPDTWNELIVNFGGPLLQDRKAVRKVRAALDQNAPPTPKAAGSSHIPRLRPYDSERQFERFIRAVRHVTTLSEARRFRSDIVTQLRRDSAVEGQDVVYIRRLETGKRLLDQKISSLSNDSAQNPQTAPNAQIAGSDTASRKKQAPLRDVLYDASGLSYFMEYMDRNKLMKLVQFYLVVDGFRGPLEGDYDDADPADPDRMDIVQMYGDYLSQPELQTSEGALQAVKQHLKSGANSTTHDYNEARRAVLQTQTQVFNRMKDKHYPSFKKSDLYFKWLAIDDNPAFAAIQNKQIGSANGADSSQTRDVPPAKRRPLVASKDSELRRAVLSSTNLKDSAKAANTVPEGRRSLDAPPRTPLFDDDPDDEHMTQSMASLASHDSDAENAERSKDEEKAVSAMQLALDDIVGEDDQDSLFSDSAAKSSVNLEAPQSAEQSVSARSSLDQGRPSNVTRPSDLLKPNISSLGLVGGPSSRGVFIDDLFADEAEKYAEDEQTNSDKQSDTDDDQVQEAAPGDLGLTEAIDALNTEIERLSAQKQIVDSLTSKAELTNNAAELRILRKSEQSLLREIKRKEMQKQQYMVQEGDSSLYGRAAVSIKSVMIGHESDGREYALYVIEVRKQAGEQMPAATWAVTRRYSQFHELHKRLRARFPSVKDLDFPRRQALFTLQRDFVEKRRVTLERYLRSLLLAPAICQSRELRAFLSQSAIASGAGNGAQVDAKDFVTRIYNSVSDGMEDFLGNIPVLDQLSVAGQNLISAATSQMNGAATPIEGIDPAIQDPNTTTEAQAELNAYETKEEAQPFVKPICDLFLETFELSKGNSWLRGRTVVVVLHQLLGGTVERRVREAANNALEDAKLASYVELLKNIMWPGGELRKSAIPRTAAERARTRKEAGLILDALIPDLAGNVVGRAHAKAASRKIVAVLNNDRLNSHLVFTMIDEILQVVFPEVMKK